MVEGVKMVTEEDNDAGPISIGDFKIVNDGVHGLYCFERVSGRGPLPDKLSGKFTEPKYAEEAYRSWQSNSPKKESPKIPASFESKSKSEVATI
jgi:hypothetical protein